MPIVAPIRGLWKITADWAYVTGLSSEHTRNSLIDVTPQRVYQRRR